MTIQVCLKLKYKFSLLIIDPNTKDYNQLVTTLHNCCKRMKVTKHDKSCFGKSCFIMINHVLFLRPHKYRLFLPPPPPGIVQCSYCSVCVFRVVSFVQFYFLYCIVLFRTRFVVVRFCFSFVVVSYIIFVVSRKMIFCLFAR